MEMTMNLPRNYIEIEEEEMMYLDGGFQVYNWIVSLTVNTIFKAFTGGGTVSFLRKVMGSNGIKQNIIKAAKKWLSRQAANRLAGILLGAIHRFLTWSVGGFFATMWDRNDKNPNNGCCGALW
ncbi:MAG: hypothetical protein ACLUVC_05095 [Longibaculum sp.]